MCVDHKEPCNLYCRSCNSIICAYCMVTARQSHECCTAKEEFERGEAELTSSLIKADGMIHKLYAALSDLDSHGHLIDDQRSAVKSEIQAKTLSLHAALNHREAELLSDLDDIVTYKMHSVQIEKEGLYSKLDPLQRTFDSIKETMVGTSREDLLVEKQSLLDKMEQLPVLLDWMCSLSIQKQT